MSEFKLTAKQIQDNWKTFRDIINGSFPTRKDALNKMYDELEERVIFAPASSYDYFHNAIPGGYVDHVLRVFNFTIKHYELWKESGFEFAFSFEELLFAAIHHDLGKLGLPGEGKEHYIPQTEKWWRENRGQLYKSNPDTQWMNAADTSLFLLNYYQVPYSLNEMMGIKLTDGLYDDANKPYYTGFDLDKKLRNSMPYILHHADMMSARFEFERWAKETNKFRYSGQESAPTTITESKKKVEFESAIATNGLDTFEKLFGK